MALRQLSWMATLHPVSGIYTRFTDNDNQVIHCHRGAPPHCSCTCWLLNVSNGMPHGARCRFVKRRIEFYFQRHSIDAACSNFNLRNRLPWHSCRHICELIFMADFMQQQPNRTRFCQVCNIPLLFLKNPHHHVRTMY